MVCEAKSGYVWWSIIFTGRGTLFDEEFLKPEFSKSMQVVLTLMEPLLNKGYCVTLDNYSSSPILTDILVKYKTDSYGTINLNRKEVPSYMKSKKLKKGETVAFRRGKALILKWKDKKDVSLTSTIHNSEMIAVRSSREEKLKPKIVVDYNDTMGGVDRADQNLASYAIPRKYGETVDTRRYPRAANRVWSDQEDHEERGSKDRASSTCGPHSDSFNDTSRRRRSNCPTNNFQTLEEANLKSKRPFSALSLTPEHRQLRLQGCQARSMWNVTDWHKVVFRDESRFVLGTDVNRVRVWRCPSERYDSPTLFYVTLPTQLV
ncbi:piggyBac transposable element-derived protein 4 [Trichonephila clavipes]|nr:piggyBac transposable element-derived protein 4 [Trichonephila clavipes]